MVKKIIVSVASLILVVGVVVGVVAVVHSVNNGKDGAKTAFSSKYVDVICQPTEFQDACKNSLSSVAKNESATPKDYLLAALTASLEELKKAFDVTSKINVKDDEDHYNYVAIDECNRWLQQGSDQMQDVITQLGSLELGKIQDMVYEFGIWLNGVYSYQASCLDQIEQPDYQKTISDGMLNSTQLTYNAVVIMKDLTNIFKAFNIKIPNIPGVNLPTSRRLLNSGGQQYPSWFSATDRKLLQAQTMGQVKPNAVVDPKGNGQFKTINDALKAHPLKKLAPGARYIIYIKPGTYKEQILITKKMINVFMYGDDPRTTVITGNLNYGSGKIAITPTSKTPPVAVEAPGFVAKGITFQNTAGPAGHQALAIRTNGDGAAFYNCVFDAYQDTVYYQAQRSFYRDCVIYGTIDFIFGRGNCVIQNSQIAVRKGLPNQFNTITADGMEKPAAGSGLVIQNCTVVADQSLAPVRMTTDTYLARPWKPYATTIVMESDLGDFIRPVGYYPWMNGTVSAGFEDTVHYSEYRNRGPAANVDQRAKWKNFRAITDPKVAQQYTPAAWLRLDKTTWSPPLVQSDIPFVPGFVFP